VWASDFDFDLRDELIAQHSDERRDRLRLMLVDDRRDAGNVGASPTFLS
jgi:S-adenosylmethionine:tRNA-ribosyltransferase-isomerase (queuine synthetase)